MEEDSGIIARRWILHLLSLTHIGWCGVALSTLTRSVAVFPRVHIRSLRHNMTNFSDISLKVCLALQKIDWFVDGWHWMGLVQRRWTIDSTATASQDSQGVIQVTTLASSPASPSSTPPRSPLHTHTRPLIYSLLWLLLWSQTLASFSGCLSAHESGWIQALTISRSSLESSLAASHWANRLL